MVFLRSPILRLLFGIAEHVAPRLGGRAAFALFCRTPARKPETGRARQAIDAAELFMMEARHHLLTNAAGSFICHEFRPLPGGIGRGTAVVVHGWGSRTEHLHALIEALRGTGLRVLALDLPGHGVSPGGSLNMAVAVGAVKTVEQWFGAPSVIVGHSLGGAIVLSAAVGSIRGTAPVEVRRLVLISAPADMRILFEAFARQCGLGARTREIFFAQVKRITGHPLASFSGAGQLSSLAIPTLVLHAPDDREVAPANADAFAGAGPHVERIWITGAGHRRILSHPKALSAVIAFSTGQDSPVSVQ